MLNPQPANMQAVPHGFERYSQFINWRIVPDENKPGKNKKLPCKPDGKVINPHDPMNWLSAEQAACSNYPIGFVFSRSDPFWFLDLDGHLIDGRPSNYAAWAFEYFQGCAVEISHSGNGVHLFGYGAHVLPPDHGCKNIAGGLEFYTHGRFVALTGNGKSGSAWLDFSHKLGQFVGWANLQPRETATDGPGLAEDFPTTPDPAYTGPADDDALIALMIGSQGTFKSSYGSKAHPRDLWERNEQALAVHFAVSGRADKLPYDWSAADASLMWHLAFWTGRDASRMVRLFERSKLYRLSKYGGKGAYRMRGILKEGLKNKGVYNKAPVAPAMVTGDGSRAGTDPFAARPDSAVAAGDAGEGTGRRRQMDLAKQVEHFKGCVYVQAAHAVMVPDGRLIRPAVFNALYGGHTFQMQYDFGKPTTEAFTAFTENRMMRFPTAIDTCFRPDLEPSAMVDGKVNTWRTPAVDEAEGDVTPFLEHVARLVPLARDRSILLTYMQSLARNPGIKFQWAPVIQGVEGNGKSLLIRVLMRAVTKLYTHLPKASQLTEKFNSWLENRCFIGVEEIKVTDRREVLEDLKDAVTNDWIEIRGMQREKKMADNFTNWLFCTNHKDAIPVDENQRRYAIFFTAQQHKNDLIREGMDENYFIRLYDWLKAEGYRFVSHWLRHAPIVAEEFNPATVCQRAPATSSTVEAISVSLGRVEQTILEAVENEEPGFRDGWISTVALRRYLHDRGVRDLSPRKMADVVKSLGYEQRFKTTFTIAEEGNRSHVYRRIDKVGGDQFSFMIAQKYAVNASQLPVQ
jgi:hypothetical protein